MTASGGRAAPAIFAVLAAMALVVLDAGVANVALPTIGHALGATPARSVLVVTAYQAAVVIALLPCGALGERFGHRSVFTVGIAAFTVGSALCAAAPSFGWLVGARFLQGLGGGAVMALGVALLRACVPEARFGRAIGWNALTVALSSAAAPSLGALILAQAGWPWLFAANLPICALALVATRALPAGSAKVRDLDPVSMLLNALVFGLLVAAAELAARTPWVTVALLAGAGISLGGLVRRELPKAAPLVPLDLLRTPSFRVSVVASVCCFVAQTAGLVALPFHLQHGFGQSPLTAGLYMTPWPLAVAVTAVFAGPLADRISSAWLCAAGAAALATGLAGLAVLPVASDPLLLVPPVVLCGVGFGLFQTPNNRNLFLSAPPHRSGAAGGLQGTARLTGQIAGGLTMTLLFALTSGEVAPRTGFALAAGLALTAGLVSLLRRKARTPAEPSASFVQAGT